MHLRNKTVQQLLSVVMVLSMLPMEVLAQETPPVTTPMDLTAITEDTSGDGWSWTQSTKTLTLTGLTLTVSDDSTHALILPDGATIDLADGTASTLTGGSRSTVYSSGEVKLRGSGSLTVYGRGWRSATLDMFIPGTLTVEYDDPDGGAVLKTDEGTEGAAICANVTLDNGILRATGPDFASADDGSSVGLRGRLTTHGSSVEAQLTARTGYASYGLYFDKQGSGRGDTWTMGLGKVTAAAGHALSNYSYGLYVDYSSVNALELDGTQLTAMGGESDQYGSQGVFAGEEIIVKNGATVTATGGQVNSSYESVGFNAVSWLTVSGENSKVLGYGGTSVKGDSKGVRCDSRLTLTDGYVFGQGGVSCTSSRNVGVEFKRLIMESGKLEGISGSPDSSYQTWGGQFNAYGLYCTGTAKITGGELIGTANGTDRELDYSAYGFYGSDELTMSGGTLRATTGDTPNASSGTLAALSVVSNKSKTQLSGGTIYARAGVSNDDRSYGMRILGTGSTLTMTNTEDAAQPLSLYVTGRNTALYATALADGGLLPEITASSAYDAGADTLTDGYTFSNKQYRKDGTAALSLSAAACLHSASDDTGLCTKCGKRVYEAVLLTDGAVTQRYAAAGEAFTAAQTEEHQGCTLRLLTDLIDDGTPLVHDPVVTITGGRFTLDLHNHTIAGKTSDYREGVVTVTGGQLRIENGTLENLYTGNDSKAQALTLLGTDTHVTLANVTAIGATPPNGDTSASVYAPDGARLTIESGQFTGRVAGTYASAPAETPHVSIAGGTFHNGLSYSIHETEANAATLLAILKEGYALAHADGTPVDLGTEPSFSRLFGTYTLSGEVQVVAHTHNVRSGRPGYCGCGYACPHDGQMPDSYFTLPVCSLCGVSYGTPLKDLRTPTGKIIIDENNWWQDFLNTVTFGLFFPTGARFTAVVMLTNVSLPADAFSLDGIRAVLALEGHTLTLSAPMTLEQSSGRLTIRDSTSSGKITGQALTVKGGRLTVEAGCLENTLDLQDYNVTLFGGTFARITSEDAAYPRAALASGTAYQQADGQLIRRSDITPTLENVAVVSCPHDEIDGITCRICGTKMVAKVAKDDTLRYFADFEDAAQYAATLEGSAITLLRDALWSSMGLPTGTYTLDLNGKTLSGSDDLMIDGSFTICDSQGGGKLWRDGTILVLGGHVAITDGQFNRVYLASDSADLSVTGGTFARIAYSGEDTSRTPLSFPAEGYTFQKADGTYANTGDVVMEENLRYLEDVTVTTPPFTITRYPVDTDLYTTTPVGYRPDFVTEVTFHIPESDPTIEFQWYQVGDPDRIKSYGSALVWQNPFTIYTFIDGPARYYGIFSYKGYSVRTDVLTVRELVCDHPGVDAGNRCSQCRAEVAASVELNGSTGYYLSLSEALALARTDAYRGCTLTILRSSTDPISVNSGSFTLTAAQGVTLGGKVTLAKKANVTLSGGSYTSSASIFGPNRIEGGTFYGAVALRDGSSVSGGSFLGAVTISDTVTVTGGTFTGDVTINNGGKLVASAGTFGNVNVKSGGGGALTGGHFGKITQIDGSPCAALLAEGYAYSDGGIINGYVPIVGGVDVVPHAQHQYVWLNQKLLCGCGHVADEDADAPVITGITDGETYYGDVTFTVTDAHDFTVTVDGQPATAEGSLYTLPADNVSHEIVAVDVAGNRTTVTVSVYQVYTVTPPTGTGFTFTGETTVRHGQDYRFRVDIAPGYSKLPDYSLLVNGQTPGGMGDVDFDECLIPSVEGDLTITVTGVADITPPEAELTIAGNPFRQFLNTVTFGLFFKSTQTVTVTVSDLGSGVDTAAWMLSDTVFASPDAITGSWTDLSLTDGSGSFSIQPGQKGYAYLRVTDRAGNITVLNSDGVVVYTDAQADTQQITYVKRSGQDVSFHVALNGNTVTGVQLADGTPLAGFTAAEDGTVTLPAATLQALAAGDYTLYVTYAPLGVAYNARYEASEAPAMTSVALSVQKAEGSVAILDDVSRDYNGQPVETPAITSLGTGALTVEYRAQGGEFTTQAPKAVGSYTVRVTAAADDDYASASAQRDFRITAKRVTIDGVTVEPSKTYDGTTDATIVTGGTLSANFDGNDLRIVTGSAAYDGKNVGTGKTVSFSGFSLEGDAAENYTLASQPAGTMADITVRTVTVEDLHIQDKRYDGTDRAEYDGEPTLGNAVSGDHVALVKGTPSFTSIRTAEDIAIRFTEFSLTGADAGNYALTQPTGITASILPYALTGGEYAVNSNDWINHDFVVTAAEGYLLSLTDTADGVWQQTLRATDETAEGRLTFYVKDLATGAISLQVTEQYRIDRTQPTGEIRVDERTAWQSFLSRITFDLFYREEQTVVITSADETSGVAATEYLLSAEDLDIPALEQETFLPYEKVLALAPDGEYVVYARITDRAGNVTCLRSDGMVLDATAPAITGAENGGVYCAAVTLTITDAYPVTVTVNGTPVELTEGRLVLRPSEETQLVTATDPAGNESRLEITVNDGHTWGDWSSNGDDTHTRTCTISGCGASETESCTGGEATCVDRAVCEVCGGAYGGVDAHRHADLRHVEAKAATTEAPGNIEHWYCAACGKYFADAQASRELRQADTVTEKLPAAPTGDEAPLTLWVIVLAACAGLALLLLVLRRRNSHRTA